MNPGLIFKTNNGIGNQRKKYTITVDPSQLPSKVLVLNISTILMMILLMIMLMLILMLQMILMFKSTLIITMGIDDTNDTC